MVARRHFINCREYASRVGVLLQLLIFSYFISWRKYKLNALINAIGTIKKEEVTRLLYNILTIRIYKFCNATQMYKL